MYSTGLVFDIKRFALHDGPGTRTTIFLKGCPLHCLWCHNPEGISPNPVLIHYKNRCIQCNKCVDNCPKKALLILDQKIVRTDACDLCGSCIQTCTSGAWEIIGNRVDCKEILKIIQRDTLFYDESDGGITFSGGEPLFQIDFLENCLKIIKTECHHIAVDTSGCAPYPAYQRILPYTDLFLYDIKMIDEQKHIHNTGITNSQILSNFVKLASTFTKMIVRVPVIPGINDQSEDIQEIGRFVKNNSNVDRIDLLPYHRLADEKYNRLGLKYSLSQIPDLSTVDVESLRNLLLEMGFVSVTGG